MMLPFEHQSRNKLIYVVAIQCLTWTLSQAGFLTLGGPSYLGYSLNQVIESRGFQAKTYKVVGKTGYITTVTRVINPQGDLNNTRGTIVIHHGVTQSNISPQLSLCVYTTAQKPPTPGSARSTSGDDNISTFTSDDYDNDGLFKSGQDDDLNRVFANIDNNTRSLFNLTNPLSLTTTSKTHTCLALHLSNRGYDVWLFEARGSTPASSEHVNKSITSEQYWDFDVENQAVEDVPYQIKKVQELANVEKVSYVGYSQSTAFMFILMTLEPEFANKNLDAFVAVAPVAFNSKTQGLFRLGWDLTTAAPAFITNNLNQPFPAPYPVVQALEGLITAVCDVKLFTATICKSLVNFIVGPDDGNNVLNLAFFSRVLATTSFKGYIQLGQWIKPHTFNRFDYKDPKLNMEHYNQSTAPEYDISNINFDKIIFVRSKVNDYLSDGYDQQELIDRLKANNVVLYKDIVTTPTYDHFSYWLGSTSFDQVIDPITRAFDEIYDD